MVNINFIHQLNIYSKLKKIIQQKHKLPKNNHQILDVNSTWKEACIKDKSALLIFDKLGGYLDILFNNDFARVAVDITEDDHIYKLKYNVLTGITGYNKFVKWLDISHDSIIGEFTIKDKSIDFNWLGFYNMKTKKREFIQNVFGNNPTLLKKCK